MKKKVSIIMLLLLFISVGTTGCITIVKTGEEAKLTGIVEFNAGDDVANFWESTALPEIEGKAEDLSEILAQAGEDLTSLADKEYAKYSMGDTGELTYTVKGEGMIKEVVTDKKAGYITITLNDYAGSIIIKIQIGTVFKGTSIRDSLNFIDFNDYTNQIEWAEVSQSINSLIQENVIDPIGYDAFQIGKQVTFSGAFTISGNDEILITPTQLSIQ